MAANLLELMGNALSGDLADRIGATIGANPQTTRSALTSAVPAILGGLLQKGSSRQGAGELLDVLTRGNHDGVVGNLAGALGGGEATASLLRTGAGLLPSLFGSRADAISSMIAGNSGLEQGSSSSLLGLLVPIVMGFVTKELRNSGGLNPGALANLLASQRGFLKAAAPPGLAAALGLGSLGDLGSGIDKLAGTAAEGAAAARSTAGSVTAPPGGGWLKWIIGLIALGLLLFLFRGCPDRTVGPEPAPPAPEPVAQPSGPPSSADALITELLPDGNTIRIASDGVESRLLAFIRDDSKAVDETTWFSFDRLEFETGSATLRPASGAQLDNIAAILRAYPDVNLKLGGYTDDTGDPAANLQLSTARAGSTLNELANRGIDTGRLAAEGYGEQFPVADNDSEEGRRKNRRIDVRVTAK